jgi:hypothetical protein
VERAAIVDVFERDENNFYLVVEPPTKIGEVKRHLARQSEEVRLFNPRTAGDLGVELLNGKTIEDVLLGAARVMNTYRAVRPAEIDVQL